MTIKRAVETYTSAVFAHLEAEKRLNFVLDNKHTFITTEQWARDRAVATRRTALALAKVETAHMSMIKLVAPGLRPEHSQHILPASAEMVRPRG